MRGDECGTPYVACGGNGKEKQVWQQSVRILRRNLHHMERVRPKKKDKFKSMNGFSVR